MDMISDPNAGDGEGAYVDDGNGNSSSDTQGNASNGAPPVEVYPDPGSPTGYADINGNAVTASGSPVTFQQSPYGGGGGSWMADGKVIAPVSAYTPSASDSSTYTDAKGNLVTVNALTGEATSTDANGNVTNLTADQAKAALAASDNQTGISGLLSGISKATGIPASILSPGNLTTAAGIAAVLGGNSTKTALGNTSIPSESMVNQQIPLGQAGQGQAFFTPNQYVAPGDVAAAQATAANQAQIMTPPKGVAQQLPAANVNTAWANQGKPVQAITPITAPQQTGIAQVATPDQIQAIQSQVANLQQNPAQAQNLAQVHAAHGGMMPGGIAGMSHGRYLQGSTDGMADKIDTSIDGVQPAKLSHGEFVIPADVVSHLGNGNSDAGAKKLYHMMDKIRMARTGTKKQGKEINPDKFMPGGIAGYASGGGIKGFNGTAGNVVANTATSPASTPGLGTSTVNGLSNYIAPYVTNMLGQEQALVNSGMPVYTGQLTAGPSDIQNQYFANANQLASTGLTPTQFQSGTFDSNAAAQYMNPYTQAALNPQLQALQLQAKQNEQGDLSKLTNAGAFGGTRQAVLQGQDAYNLLAQQSNLIGQGYNTAYNNAMNQFNTANSQSLQAQQNQEAANEASANYGLAANQALGTAGNTQQGLQQAADTASLNQFNQQVQYPQTLLNNQASMLSGLPIASAATTPNTSTISTIAGDLSGLTGIYDALSGNPNGNTSGSSGTTGGSNGTTSDIRAKENIIRIDVRPDGLFIYEFDYKPEFKNTPTAGHGRYRGLMAQEVERVYPNAVFTLDSGYKAIDYSKVPA
jgi:hypothetical protein